MADYVSYSAAQKRFNGSSEEMSNPLENDIESSPCKMRPDEKEPCALLEYNKNNWVCHKCSLTPGKGDHLFSNSQLEKMISSGQIKFMEYHFNCIFPGCKNKVSKRLMYCTTCAPRIYDRKKSWERIHGKVEVPMDWLHRGVGL